MKATGCVLSLLIFPFLILSCSAQSATDSYNFLRSGNVTIFGDLNVVGTVRTSKLQSDSIMVNGSLNVTGLLNSKTLSGGFAQIGVVLTNQLSSPTGVIQIIGDLQISDQSVSPTVSASFLDIGGVRQWRLQSHEDFESYPVEDIYADERNGDDPPHGWVGGATVGTCGGTHDHMPTDHFLMGNCTTNETAKLFTGLGDHSQLRLTAVFHFIDAWEGETAYLKANDKVVWSDSTHWQPHGVREGINVCGGEHPERKFGTPIDVVIKHSGPSIKISFGTLLPRSHGHSEACEKLWGVDDIMLYLK